MITREALYRLLSASSHRSPWALARLVDTETNEEEETLFVVGIRSNAYRGIVSCLEFYIMCCVAEYAHIWGVPTSAYCPFPACSHHLAALLPEEDE